MPVTARLSKKFYDTLGEDLATELVDWFNQVDAAGRCASHETAPLIDVILHSDIIIELLRGRAEPRSQLASLIAD